MESLCGLLELLFAEPDFGGLSTSLLMVIAITYERLGIVFYRITALKRETTTFYPEINYVLGGEK